MFHIDCGGGDGSLAQGNCSGNAPAGKAESIGEKGVYQIPGKQPQFQQMGAENQQSFASHPLEVAGQETGPAVEEEGEQQEGENAACGA